MRALQLVAAQSAVHEVFLFTRGFADEPALVGKLGTAPPSELLLQRISELFEEMPEDSEETAFVPVSDATTTEAITALSSQHRLIALRIVQGGKRLLVGVMAIMITRSYRPLGQAFLNDIALQLFQSGDLIPVRAMD